MAEGPPDIGARDEPAGAVRWVSPEFAAGERARSYASVSDPEDALAVACRWSQLKTADRRRKAAIILAALAGPGVYECAVSLLADPASATRLAAIAALGNLDDARAVADLVEQLKTPARAAAIRALCRSPSPAALPSLRQLEDGGSLDALLALVDRADDGALERLRAFTGDTDRPYGDRVRALRGLAGRDPAVLRRPDDASALIEVASGTRITPTRIRSASVHRAAGRSG